MRISEMQLARLDDWMAEKGHTCNVRLSITGIAVQCMHSFPISNGQYHCVSGSATGLREDASNVVDGAIVACQMAERSYRVEAEVRAEVERRMLSEASATAPHPSDSDRGGGAAE